MLRPLATHLTVLLTFGLVVTSDHAAGDDRTREQALRHYRQGQAALNSERWGEAEEEFGICTQLDPLLVAGHYGLGQTFMATRRYPDAVRAYIEAENAFHEQQAEAFTNSLAFQEHLDDQILALEDDLVSAQRQVSGPNAQRIQSAVDRVEAQIQTLQALRHRETNEELPTPHWLSLALGGAYFRNENLPKAEEAYRAAVKVKSDLGEAHLNLSVVYMLTNRLDEAEQEVALAEQSGIRVPKGLKDDIAKRKAGGS